MIPDSKEPKIVTLARKALSEDVFSCKGVIAITVGEKKDKNSYHYFGTNKAELSSAIVAAMHEDEAIAEALLMACRRFSNMNKNGI